MVSYRIKTSVIGDIWKTLIIIVREMVKKIK